MGVRTVIWVDSRVDPYTFAFPQNPAGRVRLSSGCFIRQRCRRSAARAEGDSNVREKAEALQEAPPRREGRGGAGAGQEPLGPRDGARPGEVSQSSVADEVRRNRTVTRGPVFSTK